VEQVDIGRYTLKLLYLCKICKQRTVIIKQASNLEVSMYVNNNTQILCRHKVLTLDFRGVEKYYVNVAGE